MKEKIKKICKVENWKKSIIAIIIIYALIWSYFYLAIQYAEHRQKSLERAMEICKYMQAEEAQETCVEFYTVTTKVKRFFFEPILGK